MSRIRKDLRSFGQKLKAIRESRPGLTQDKFADAMGISADTVKNWEQGWNYPRHLDDVVKIADFFQCDFDYLLGDQEQPNKEYAHIMEMTGLSEKATESLAEMAAQKNDLLPIISGIVENTKLLYCIESAIFSQYSDPFIDHPLYVSAESMYNAEKAAVYAELMEFINNTRESNGLDPL